MLAISQNQTRLYMRMHPTTDEKFLCATWFIALLFMVLQIVLTMDFDQDLRRARRVRVKTESRTIRIIRSKRKAA
jgi:hypothetical protein